MFGRMRLSLTICLGIAALTGCSQDRSTSSNTPPPLVRISTAPILEITPRGYPSGGTRLPDGRIVIADSWRGQIDFFDRTGKLLKSAGRPGTGPGEYGAPFVVGRCDGENIHVRDGSLFRATVIDTSGSFVRSYPADQSAFVCNGDNEFLFVRADPPQSAPQQFFPAQIQGTVFFTRGDRKPKAIIPRIFAYQPTTLGPVTRFALGADRFFVTYGFPDSQFVDVFNLKGKKIKRFATNLPTRIVTDEMYNGFMEQTVSAFEKLDARARSHAFLHQFPKPLHTPVANQLLVDPEGHLWLVRTFPGDQMTLIRVFDEDGGMMADVELPVQVQVYEVGEDYILGMVHPREQRSKVVVYNLDRSGFRR